MALNIPLMILSRVLLSVFAKLAVGVTVAGLTYAFLNNTVLPVVHRIESAILSQLSSLSSIGGPVGQLIVYLDFPHCISLLLTASAACFSLKIMSVAVRAFGINTG